MKTFSKTATKTAKLYTFAQVIQGGTNEEIIDALDGLITSPLFATVGWQINFAKLRGVLMGGYPAAFARQCQNAFLMRFNSGAIVQAFRAIDNKAKSPYDLRLYVDGDFSSVNDVEFWFDLIDGTKARVYGYSKSFDALLAYDGKMPSNYVLNVSSGHNSDADTITRVKALPITRGDFIAVSIGRRVKSNEHGTRAVNQALRESFGAKAFPCPGACGTCTGKGHACGMQALKGLPIVIAVH